MSKISVLTACYNHEKYLNYYIESLLAQSFEDWELLIVDDNSRDKSVNIIKQYNDCRIKLICNDINQGPGVALNKAYENATGDYFVICASDDMIEPDYFSYILEQFNKGFEIIYSPLQTIDKNNKRYSVMNLPETNNNYKLLARLFKTSNCLYSPGLSFNKRLAKILFPTSIGMVQHQDYQWHIQLLINSEKIKFAEKPFILYRKIKTSNTLSSISIGEYNRLRLEIEQLMNTFLCIKDIEAIKKIFPDVEIKNQREIPFILAIQAIKLDLHDKKRWGYNLLLNLLRNKEIEYTQDFTFGDFLKISNEIYYSKFYFNIHKIKLLLKKIIKGFY